jgi:Flp pilus assembly protein TadG
MRSKLNEFTPSSVSHQFSEGRTMMKGIPTNRRNSEARRRRGAMMVLVAAMISVMLGMVVFAVDVGWIVTNKTQLQSAADAAALAGAGTLSESYDMTAAKGEAIRFASLNAKESNASIQFGTWDPAAKIFTASNEDPNAVRVTVRRMETEGSAVPAFFSRIYGHRSFNISAESIAVGPSPVLAESASEYGVYVTSTKHLSNVVLRFADDTHQKFEGLSGYADTFKGTGEHAGKVIVGVWVKSGCYTSGDGPGYGEYLHDPGDSSTVHGNIKSKGCYAHVTATFSSTGVAFTESGSWGPIRLVQ